ncbi:MAG: hypothetical protein J6S23_01500 [Clostridia bacterium]|nr:hypothetical protein [Clostridia bacterium]
MANEKKTTFKDFMQALAGGIGIVGGLFTFSLLLGMLFMDYDPRTMLEGIAQDFKDIFGGIR